MSALDHAWSVLKALPEQQSFRQISRSPNQQQFDEQLTNIPPAGQTVADMLSMGEKQYGNTYSQRMGTIPPSLMRVMGDQQFYARNYEGKSPQQQKRSLDYRPTDTRMQSIEEQHNEPKMKRGMLQESERQWEPEELEEARMRNEQMARGSLFVPPDENTEWKGVPES